MKKLIITTIACVLATQSITTTYAGEYEDMICSISATAAQSIFPDMRDFYAARMEAGCDSWDNQTNKQTEQERQQQRREQELEQQVEELEEQINAQNSVIYAPRGVQVITPGRVIHY